MGSRSPALGAVKGRRHEAAAQHRPLVEVVAVQVQVVEVVKPALALSH